VRYFATLLTFDRLTFMVIGASDPAVLDGLDLRQLGSAWVPLAPRNTGARWPPTYVFPAEQFPAMPALLARLAQVG
jgi:hypothetical protein